MLKYQFPCSSLNVTRQRFENRVALDGPYRKGLFGIDLYEGGLHVTHCGQQVKGFYMSCGDGEGTRGGSPMRVYFRGTFREDGEQAYFEAYIFPSPGQFLFMIVAFIWLFLNSSVAGFLMLAFACAFFLYEIISDIKSAAAALEKMVC